MRIINHATVLVITLAIYLFWCLIDVKTTDPVNANVVKFIVTSEINQATYEKYLTKENDYLSISKKENFVIVYDVTRNRTASLRTERQIVDLNGYTYPISVTDRNVVPEHITLNVPVDVPNYIPTGCGYYLRTSEYRYSYNLLT